MMQLIPLRVVEGESSEMMEREEVVEEQDGYCDEVEQQAWTKQITARGVITSIVIGSIFSVIAMKLSLTTGMSPNLNVSAALLAYVFIVVWTKFVQKAGFVSVPFTRQENTIIQTCAVACYSIAIGGGFGTYLLGLSKKIYDQTGVDNEGNSPGSYKEPGIAWMIGFLFLVCFVGLFVLIPLRKVLIIDYELTFPTGMATAVLINGFHSRGDNMAKKQLKGFMKFFSLSFLWGFFQWFYTGQHQCGFSQFPTFGLQAWRQTFYFDFSMTIVGTGMICSHVVNLSLLLGAVVSWGVMWPLIGNQRGDWFPADLPETGMKSLNGYKVFISVALLLGDGMYNFVKIIYFTFKTIHGVLKHKNINSAAGVGSKNKALDDLKQDQVFTRDAIPLWVGAAGYILLSIISVIAIPFIFPQLKWYYVAIAYLLAPPLAFCNAYGAGLTDINMAYNYSKLAIFVLGAVAGKEHGVVAGLAGCGLIKSVISVSCILMQDLKTGHLTLTSPRAMLLSQAIGTAIGCLVGPLCFFLFYRAFDVGNPNGEFKAPLAVVYRNMALVSVQGLQALPRHCLHLCFGFFAFAVGTNLLKDVSPPKIGKWMPLPIAMAVPFFGGAYIAVDMCVGSLVVFVWHRLNANKAELMVPAVASGLICGEGLWILPASVLALAKIYPPICMKFSAS